MIGVLAGIITIATGLHAYLAEKSRQQQSVAAEDRRLSRERETFVRRVQVLMARADRGSRLSRIFLGTHAVDDSGTIDLDNWDDDESGWLELQEGVKAVLNMLGTVVWSTDDFAMVGTDAQDVMGDIELSVMQANHAAELMRLSPDRWKTQMVGFLHALTSLEKECTYLIARLAEEIERA
ncbi:hypothetical protein JY460_00015 [Stenotrophomonas maltophilia]|uniref:Uncharacterized protein n=1 Tax=Stenotrophomonas maltophilia TaxID=40324 RepID=A0ABD7CAL4_STEMA|nr:hypothetical protein [Stenotrophomonas maltophilia]MBN5086500.1 hypothetical protein [Stenotrophomonas maltophilia]QQQ44396.1 hypothetical protein JJL50_10360 [Stenotrophomonas maltophilia]